MELTATHLISLPRTTITHLVSGARQPLGHGTLELHLLSFPVAPLSPQDAASSQPPNYAAVTSTLDPQATAASTDQGQCLLLSLKPEAVHEDEIAAPTADKFELPLAQTSQVISSPTGGYWIPFDGGFSPAGTPTGTPSSPDDSGGAGFVEVNLAPEASADERDSFEEILASLTLFQPHDFQPDVAGQRVGAADGALRNQLVLVDADGDVVGKLEGHLSEDPSLKYATAAEGDDAVVISTGADGALTASRWQPADNPTNSSIVSFANYVSGGLVYGSEWASEHLTRAGERATSVPRDANGKELTFSPIAKKGADAGLKVTQTALAVSGKTVGLIAGAAAGVGDKLGRTLGIQSEAGGKVPTGLRGLVNRSLVAVNTVADSLEYGGKTLLSAGGNSANQVISHHFGDEAGELSATMGNSVKSVALIYVDIRGIQRRALLKTAGKSALKAKMKDGSVVELEPESEQGIKRIAEKGPRPVGAEPPALPPRRSASPPALPPRTGPPPIPARPVMDSKTG